MHKIIANVRTALEHKSLSPTNHDGSAVALPLADTSRYLELTSQFTRELERVGGIAWGLVAQDDVCRRVIEVANDEGMQRIAIGDGVTLKSNAIAKRLKQEGFELVQPKGVKEAQRAEVRESIAGCDLGIVEADYAIASTGTLCVVASSTRPSSLTILPPNNFIMVNADRILPTLADVVEAIGPQRFAEHRVAFITGPSRTADIEKMIVIGVHGPKRLYSAVLTP